MSEETYPLVFMTVLTSGALLAIIASLFGDNTALIRILSQLEQAGQATCHDFEPELYAWRELPELVSRGFVREVPNEERLVPMPVYDPDDLDHFEAQAVLYELTANGRRHLNRLKPATALKQHLRGESGGRDYLE